MQITHNPIVIANWKCNPATMKEAELLFEAVKKAAKTAKNIEIAVCPPFIYLPHFLKIRKKIEISFGAQNCFWEKGGAFTGEVSPVMLKDLGCQYVIIGHSERRKYFGETDDMINKKIKAVLLGGLRPVFCIGETGKEKEEGKTREVLSSQIERGLNGVAAGDIKNIIIAYEPIWAIGSGEACPADEANETGILIKNFIHNLCGLPVENFRVLYGGSVNSQNAAECMGGDCLSGLLVGGASLNPEEFVKIAKAVSDLTC